MIDFLSGLPYPVLMTALLTEAAAIAGIVMVITENKKQPSKGGSKLSQASLEEYKAVFKIIERRLNELSSRCDSSEKRIQQLEAHISDRSGSTPAGLENKVNELQKAVFSIIERIKEL